MLGSIVGSGLHFGFHLSRSKFFLFLWKLKVGAPPNKVELLKMKIIDIASCMFKERFGKSSLDWFQIWD